MAWLLSKHIRTAALAMGVYPPPPRNTQSLACRGMRMRIATHVNGVASIDRTIVVLPNGKECRVHAHRPVEVGQNAGHNR